MENLNKAWYSNFLSVCFSLNADEKKVFFVCFFFKRAGWNCHLACFSLTSEADILELKVQPHSLASLGSLLGNYRHSSLQSVCGWVYLCVLSPLHPPPLYPFLLLCLISRKSAFRLGWLKAFFGTTFPLSRKHVLEEQLVIGCERHHGGLGCALSWVCRWRLWGPGASVLVWAEGKSTLPAF